ncbi:MAG: histidine phosphatase family protein [Geobacter sp.]|nr:MAG: histidine phosphatase family protein [Geobacter sp.]
MLLYLLRHGESEANVGGFINDDPEKPLQLTGKGREQAATAAQALSDIGFSHAYVSQFPRARQTAEIILAGRNLSLTMDARLNERRSGLDGQPVEAFNGLVRPDPVRIKPANGESFLEQMQRVGEFLDEIAQHYPEGIALVVSHENPIQAAVALAGRDAEAAARGGLGNCEWLRLEWPLQPPTFCAGG